MADEKRGGGAGRLSSALAYPLLLCQNRNYLALFMASVLQQLGGWANLIATLKVLEEGGGSVGVKTSLVFFMRNIPSVLIFPLAGYLADHYNKKVLLIASNLCAALVAASFVFARSLPLLCALIFLKNACSNIYDPAKRSTVPLIVDKEKIAIAMTLDGVAWSSMLALGAALGGLMTSQLGIVKCFLLDAVGFLLSCCCLVFLPNDLRVNGANKDEVGRGGEAEGSSHASALKGGDKSWTRTFAEECLAIFTEPSLRTPLLYTAMKASGGLIWGPADVLNLKFSQVDNFQIGHDQPLTLGISYAFVGLGCFVGPLFSNLFLDTKREGALIKAVACGVGFLGAGYGTWALAASFWMVETGNFLRAAASAVVWIKSTIVIQLFCDAKYLGRLFALEIAWYTLANSVSMFSVGVMVDQGLSKKHICAGLTLLSLAVFVVWIAINRMRRVGRERMDDQAYEMLVSASGDDEGDDDEEEEGELGAEGVGGGHEV